MGLEAECRAWWKGRPSIGKALLEPAELIFRGEFRVTVPLAQVKSCEARGGQLQVAWPEGEVVLELGKAAETWMLKIRYPRGRMEKLGVKPGLRIAVTGIEDPEFLEELSAAAGDGAVRGKPSKECDLIFAGADSPETLASAARIGAVLKPAGALWIVFPKGRKDFKDSDVRAALRAAGLVDIKVVGFSKTHSALKWMIPKSQR